MNPRATRAVSTVVFAGLCLTPLLPEDPLAWLPWVLRVPALVALGGYWLMREWKPARDWAAQVPPGTMEKLGVTWVVMCWLLLKLVGIRAASTDDNIYFYLANRMAEGAVPYRDFFFAHPPVHLLIPALVFKLFGWSMTLARCIPVLAQTLSALCVWWALRPRDALVAFLTLVLHFTAAEVLESSNDLNGQDLMCLGVCAAFLALSRERWLLAGILAGLGLGSALYGLVAVAAFGLWTLRRSRPGALKYTLGVLVGFWGIALPFIALSGSAFFDDVFRYHTLKTMGASTRISVFADPGPLTLITATAHNLAAYFTEKDWQKLALNHSFLWVGLLAAGITRWRRREAEPLVTLAALAVGLSVVQFADLNRLFSFYTVPLVVLLTVPAAYALAFALRTPSVPLLLLFSLHVWPACALNERLYADEVENRGARVDFTWRPLQTVPALSDLVKTIYFDDHRIKGALVPAYRQFVWHKLQYFSTLPQIAQWVESHSTPQDTLVGASGYAPAIALEAHRRLAGDEADTNSMRFQSGLFTSHQLWERACADHVKFVVSAPRSYFDAGGMRREKTVQTHFAPAQTWDDAALMFTAPVHLELWQRISENACAPVD